MGTTFTHMVGTGLLPARWAHLSTEALNEHARTSQRWGAWWDRMAAAINRMVEHMHEHRDALRLYRELRRYDDHLLTDIGFTRAGLWRQIRDAVRRLPEG